MRLAIHVINYTRNEVEDVAIVAGHRVGNVDDVHASKLLLRRGLGRVDAGLRLHHIHHFANLTLVRKLHLQAGSLAYRDSVLQRIEALFFNMELIATGGEVEESAS